MAPEDEPVSDPLVAELEAMLRDPPDDVGAAAQDLVTRACDEDEDRGRQRVLALIDHLEGRAFDVSRVLAIRGPKEALLLARALEILDAIRDTGLDRLGEQPTDVLTEVDREEKWLADLAAVGFDTRDQSLRGRLDRLIVSRLKSLAAAPPQHAQPGASLRVIAEAVGDLMERGQTRLAEQLGSVRARLWRKLLERARGLEGREADAYLRQLADEVNDRAEDVLARAESLSYEAALKLLSNAERDVRRALALTRRMRLQGRRRELRRMRRRIRAATQDRRVRARQTAQVGPKTLRTIEILVFFSILAVLGILGYDLASTDPLEISDPVASERAANTRLTLAWIDAVICAFFLVEFGWRWALSGWSGFYLWRCFFIDVLPSVPFGLISELMLASAGRAEAAKGLRALRGVRLLRGLRAMRPLFQLYRIMAFTLQGMDRLARRNAALLNRNIVLFDPPEEEEEGSVSAALRLRRFRDRLVRALRLTLSEIQPSIRQPLALGRLDALTRRLDRAPHYELHHVSGPEADLRDIRVEAVIEELLTLEATTVEVHLGEETAGRLSRFLRMLDIPVVRKLPLVRETAAGTTGLDPYQALAQAGHGLGRWLERMVERFRFFGDLTGIVTGSQLLDRIGSTLVRATQRPAVRLLMLGFGAVIVSWLIAWLGAPEGSMLKGLGDFFNNVVGPGVIALGAACLVVQIFGRWIKKLAGETTELFEKVSEAQGLNLLKFHKLGRRREDLGLIFDRALAAEISLTDRDGDVTQEREEFCSILPHEVAGGADHGRLARQHESVVLLYLDYLDGAILHRSNVKSTEQFLGNLEIEAIRTERLQLGRKDRKELKKLDLNRDRPIPTGPYLWFRFITESLSQRCAKLVLHYNRTAIPLDHRSLVPAGQVERMDAWLATPRRHSTTSRPAIDPWSRWWIVITWPFVLLWLVLSKTARWIRALVHAVLRDDDDHDHEVLGAAYFNALHFMTTDPDRDAQVETTFGPEVRQRLDRDRRRMVREVFSSYPWEHLPRHRRTVNPYTLYFAWLGRGKVIFLPLRIIWFWLRWWGRAFRALGRLIAEQLKPEELRPERRPGLATLDVALRKINRMHLPVFMAALDMRARFDPEYLGLRLPGCEPQPDVFGFTRDDLDLIGAREYRRERYREMRNEAQRQMRRLDELLQQLGWPERNLAQALDPDGGPTADTASGIEATRAVAIAWIIDYEGCRTLVNAPRDIDRALESFLSKPGDARPKRKLRVASQRRLFDDWIARSAFRDRDEAAMDLLRRAFASNRGRVKTLMKLLRENGGKDNARKRGLETLALVARYPDPWTRQLITLRAVQTLCVLDIRNARSVVSDLGGYAPA